MPEGDRLRDSVLVTGGSGLARVQSHVKQSYSAKERLKALVRKS